MSTSWIRPGILCLASLLLASCAGDGSGEAPDEGWGSGAACDATLDYVGFGQVFMQTYCTGCHSSALQGAARHGAPLDHDFDRFDKIVEYAEHIDEFAAAGPNRTNTFTPPPGATPSPSLQDRRLLGAWLACGPTR